MCLWANLGESDDINGPRSIQASVDELHAFLNAARIPAPYLLVGHSYGGLVSMIYAAQHPEDVQSLLLVDGLPPFENELDELANSPDSCGPCAGN